MDGLPFEGWGDVSDALLGAAELDRVVAIPQVLSFVCTDESRVDLDAAQRLFDFARFQQVFEPDIPEESWESATRERYRAVKRKLED